MGKCRTHFSCFNKCNGKGWSFGTFVGSLNACTSVVAIDEGRCVHEQISQSYLKSDGFVASTLVDMYAKCIKEAERVFSRM